MVEYKENVIKAFGENVHGKLGDIIGPRYIDYRTAWDNATPGDIPPFPIHLDFEFYDCCNQRCSFCPRNAEIHSNLPYEINTGSKLNWSVLKKIASECQLNNLYSVNFGAYAEPLLYDRLFDAIRLFVDAGVVDTRVITNGLLLNKCTDDIFESGLLNLYVSLDAFTEDSYRKQRGRGFNKVKDNLLRFLEEKKRRKTIFPIVRVSFVENENNVNEKSRFLEFWKDKVDFIDVQLMLDYTKQAADDCNDKKWDCIDPFRRLSIISTGEILPCCSFYGRALAVGNAYQNSLKDVWQGEKINKLRGALLKGSIKLCMMCQS